MDFRETAWNHIAGEIKGEFYSAEQKWVNKVRKLAEKYPNDVEIIAENEDGSIYCKLPIRWFKMSPPKQMSEESKEKARERFSAMHNKNKSEDDEDELDTEI